MAGDELQQIHAVDELHAEHPTVAIGDELVKRDDVGMVNFGQRTKFLLEVVECHGVRRPQDLERHFDAGCRVDHAVDVTEGSCTEPCENAEPAGDCFVLGVNPGRCRQRRLQGRQTEVLVDKGLELSTQLIVAHAHLVQRIAQAVRTPGDHEREGVLDALPALSIHAATRRGSPLHGGTGQRCGEPGACQHPVPFHRSLRYVEHLRRLLH